MNCGDPTIDGLLAGEASVRPLIPGVAEAFPARSVGYLQELLRGHGYNSLPDARGPSYGMYGPSTRLAVTDYRRRNGLAAGEQADSALIGELVRHAAPHAVLGPAYVPLVLNVPFTPVIRFVWLTSLFETGGRLGTLNLNTDQCGVSFGILQWSQKPGQLRVILQACCTREPAEWERIMGGTSGGTGILDHTAQRNGGVDTRGSSIDPRFELTEDPWKTRLEALGASPAMQRVQVDLASNIYTNELKQAREYAHGIQSERGFAFLLDLANQFGAGRVAQQYAQQYKTAGPPGVPEPEILKRMEDAFTNIARLQFQPQVRARREFFRSTALLSDQPLAGR
jgi:peptidoglycan hydrolase-like protein with peptidoglycan-binding domain